MHYITFGFIHYSHRPATYLQYAQAIIDWSDREKASRSYTPLEPVSHRNNPGTLGLEVVAFVMLSSRRFRIIRGAYPPTVIMFAASTKYPNGFAGYDMMYNGSVLAGRPISVADASSRPEHMCMQP